MLIRQSGHADLAQILAVVNDAAQAYRGVIPADRWHEPYMSKDELESEIGQGVVFWLAEKERRLSGVMGIQDKGAVARWCVTRMSRRPHNARAWERNCCVMSRLSRTSRS